MRVARVALPLGVAIAVASLLASCGSDRASIGGAADPTERDEASVGDSGAATDGPSVAFDAGIEAAAPCTGKAAVRRGLTSRDVTVSGVKRTYLVYLPTAADPNAALPLVFVHHGLGMSGQAMHDITGYAALADREGIAIAFPDGESGPNGVLPPWNVGTGVCGAGAFEQATGDDIGFVEAMRTDIEADQCIDRAHVFVTGFSMGGFFANQVGCIRPDLVRGIAPHSGGTHDFASCAPGHTPVILFHGTADPVIAALCGSQARDAWAKKNGCTTGVDTIAIDGGTCELSQGCAPDGQVELCTFTGMGHAWAGGAPNMAFSDSARPSATELQWAFFKKYAW
jgi:polyhydroxybutyrate depolymerase